MLGEKIITNMVGIINIIERVNTSVQHHVKNFDNLNAAFEDMLYPTNAQIPKTNPQNANTPVTHQIPKPLVLPEST
ncbi:MAG: hypothetical protein K2M43_01230 [Mycoplasmoidaceae bacterium]|nr:hypothetical protein [Mycoplasmoidaceae bacterium]